MFCRDRGPPPPSTLQRELLVVVGMDDDMLSDVSPASFYESGFAFTRRKSLKPGQCLRTGTAKNVGFLSHL
jgi:hypothetical protein